MAALTPYLLIASTAVSTGSAITSAIGQSRMARYNATVAMREAKAAKGKAAFDERRKRREIKTTLSQQRAQYGLRGVELEGSPLEVLGETAGKGELDALAIRYGGDIAASTARSEAGLYRLRGKAAMRTGFLEAGSSLLAGAGRYSKWKLGIGG
jgi:hypothetical protein